MPQTALQLTEGSKARVAAEALGIGTEFAPSLLVARLLSSAGFALGSTMAFRRRELDASGGFHGIREYLAEVWRHQVRWSRTIRISRPGGYLGNVVTHATFWCLVAALAGQWEFALAGLAIRLAAAASALGALGASQAGLAFVPFRDLVGFAVWCAGLFGNTVEWRTDCFRLLRDGRIVRQR